MKRWLVFFIFLSGLFFRFWEIGFDLPHSYYGDESYFVYHSIKFGTGDLNPHWFIWPTFFQYILFFLFGTYYLIGTLIGTFTSTTDFLYHYLKDPTSLFLIARTTSALFGTASIYFIFQISKKIYNFKIGYLAAFIFAILPLHVRYSHFAVTDGPMVFMMLVSSLFILMMYQQGTLFYYLLAGLFTGLATATKYPALVLLVSISIAH